MYKNLIKKFFGQSSFFFLSTRHLVDRMSTKNWWTSVRVLYKQKLSIIITTVIVVTLRKGLTTYMLDLRCIMSWHWVKVTVRSHLEKKICFCQARRDSNLQPERWNIIIHLSIFNRALISLPLRIVSRWILTATEAKFFCEGAESDSSEVNLINILRL